MFKFKRQQGERSNAPRKRETLESLMEGDLSHVIWEFHVKAEHVTEFERHYSGQGTWAQLFREDPAYKETVLLRDVKTPGRYLTTDVWQSEASYQAFQDRTRERYRELDAQFEAYMDEEALIGYFEVVE